MPYKVQDGIQFQTRQEYRDYMMMTYYTFHDLKSGSHVKPVNSIQGQMFDIIKCSNCELILLDFCEQVQIDGCNDCHIFVGSACSTIFLRNCSNCKIFCCTKQLRIRECHSCVFYTYSMSEIHIELSSNLLFGPFNGGYPEHREQLQQGNLLPIKNLWYQVYDHNTIPGQSNWRLLQESEYDPPWFPAGECERAVPISPPQDISSSKIKQGQVGESYGLEKMKQDHILMSQSRNQLKSTSPPIRQTLSSNIEKVNQLRIETALLVASARAKGIDVAVWLSESPTQKLVPVSEFNNRFISLGLTVGIQEDWETKRELDLATSPAALATIILVCGEGFDENGAPFVNVHTFLCLCDESVQRYLINARIDEEEIDQNERIEENIVNDPIQEIPQPPPSPPPVVSLQQETIEYVFENVEENIYPQDDSMNEPNLPERGRKIERERAKRSNSEPRKSATSTRPIIHASSGVVSESTSAFEKLLSNVVRHTDLYHIIQVHLGFLETYTMTPARGKVVVSTSRLWLTHSQIKEAFCSARLQMTTPQLYTLINLVINFSQKYLDGTYSHRISIDNFFSSPTHLSPSPSPSSSLQNHTSSTTVPSTVPVVETANSTAATPSLPSQLLNSALITSTVYLKEKGLLHSEWLKRYLIHLRVRNNRTGNWNLWINNKITTNSFHRKNETYFVNEFHKALIGREYDLNKAELEKMIQKFEIISSTILSQEIENRVEEWVLDSQGTRDFHHSLYLEYKKYLRKQKEEEEKREKERKEKEEKEEKEAKERGEGKEGKGREGREVKERTREISTPNKTNRPPHQPHNNNNNHHNNKIPNELIPLLVKNLREEKRVYYENQEKRSGEVTMEIFLKYDKENRRAGYVNTPRFGDWLSNYIRKEIEQIQVKKEKYHQQKRLMTQSQVIKKTYCSWVLLEHYLREGIKVFITNSQQQREYYLKFLHFKRIVYNSNLNEIGTKEDEKKILNLVITKEMVLKYYQEEFIHKLIELKEREDCEEEERVKREKIKKREEERKQRVERNQMIRKRKEEKEKKREREREMAMEREREREREKEKEMGNQEGGHDSNENEKEENQNEEKSEIKNRSHGNKRGKRGQGDNGNEEKEEKEEKEEEKEEEEEEEEEEKAEQEEQKEEEQKKKMPIVIKGFFYLNKKEAIESGKIHFKRIQKTLSQRYKGWKQEKAEQQRQAAQKLLEEEQQKAKKKTKQMKKSNKEYEKWLKLHSVHKYYSVNEKKKRFLPNYQIVEHVRDFDCVAQRQPSSSGGYDCYDY